MQFPIIPGLGPLDARAGWAPEVSGIAFARELHLGVNPSTCFLAAGQSAHPQGSYHHLLHYERKEWEHCRHVAQILPLSVPESCDLESED